MPGRHADTARHQQLAPLPGFGGPLLNVLAAAVGLGIVLGVMAFAIAIPDSGTARGGGSSWKGLLPVQVRPAPGGPYSPRIVSYPEPASTSTSATFRFSEPRGAGPFSCRLDDGDWAPCTSPVAFGDLSLGAHDFVVRDDSSPRGAEANASTLYPWQVVPPEPFKISPQLSDLSDLYPGSPPVILPLQVSNPNSVPIAVTSLQVAIGQDPPGCPSAENLELIPSNASGTRPLRIRAGASAWVPGHGFSAPSIRMLNRPVDQDACQRAHFPLVFSGTAHG